MAKDEVAPPVDGPKQRLFLAVEVPDEARRAVAQAIEPWRAAFPRARWVPEESWHVTLKFLGPTSPRLVSWIERIVVTIAAECAPVRARIRGLGAFPTPRRGRVLWAGVDDPANGLAAIVAGLEAGLEEEFRPEMRAPHPHVTVARSEPPLRLPESYAWTPLTSETFVCGRVVLFQSHVGGHAARYEPLRTFALGA